VWSSDFDFLFHLRDTTGYAAGEWFLSGGQIFLIKSSFQLFELTVFAKKTAFRPAAPKAPTGRWSCL
jgi:hypothetical protein